MMPRICFCSPGSSIAGAVDQSARLVGLEALERIDVQSGERVGVLLGDLLDLDAAFGREHEERLLRAAVESDREVVLLGDVGGLLDPDLANDVAVDVETEDVAGLGLRVGRILGELHAAGLAAPAGQNLSLDDDRPADLLRGGPRFLRGRREAAVGDGDAEAREELLALVLVEIHRRGTLPVPAPRPSPPISRYTRARPHPGGGDHPPPSASDDSGEGPTRLRRLCADISLGRHDADHLAGRDRLAGGDRQLGDAAGAVRVHLVLHLHRLDDAEDLARPRPRRRRRPRRRAPCPASGDTTASSPAPPAPPPRARSRRRRPSSA